MALDERDKAALWDVLDAARRIQSYVAGVTLDAFQSDEKLRLAVERLLEIIGEGSRRLSHAVRREADDIPWRPMIALRNVLAHEYDEVRADIVWRVATQRIPELVEKLGRLIDA